MSSQTPNKLSSFILPGLAAFSLIGCSTVKDEYNDLDGGERGAVIGTGVGAAAGAIIADDDLAGGLIGAGIGAAAGYAIGSRGDRNDAAPTAATNAPYRTADNRFYDSATGRYYYRDPATGATYYENGERRS